MELINDPILITLIEEDYLHTLSLYRWNISLNNHYQDDQIFSQIQSSTITIAPTGLFSYSCQSKMKSNLLQIKDSTRQNGSTVIDYLSLAKSRKKSRRKARIQSSTFIRKRKMIQPNNLFINDLSEIPNTIDAECQTDGKLFYSTKISPPNRQIFRFYLKKTMKISNSIFKEILLLKKIF